MKYICFTFCAVIASHFCAFSQSWPGYETGRFSGISSANLRPGGMSPIPYKVDATLFGVHLFTEPKNIFSKDIADVTFTGVFNKLSGFDRLSSNRTMVFTNLQGPSVLVQAAPRVSVAFAWNVRFMWLSDFSQPQITQLFDEDVASLQFSGVNETGRVLFTGWNEFGIGAGGVVWEESWHSFSVGAFAKLVYGIGHMNLNLDNTNIDVNGKNVNASFDMNSEISSNFYDVVDGGGGNFVDRPGYGFDLGLEYKFINPRACPGGSNYRLKAGIAVTDLGKMRYSSSRHFSASNASATGVPLETFRNLTLSEASDTLSQIYNITQTTVTDHSVNLPMSLRVYTEVNIRRRAIIYNEFHFVFAQMTNPDMPMLFRYNLTPRFEDDRFGIYLPLTFTNYIPASAGLAIRLMPFIIGSGNLFTFWAYEDRGTPIDIYVTLKIPILNPDERVDWRSMTTRRR